MRRFALFLLLGAGLLSAATRLYLTDGTYHTVREYKVEADRVRYYSTERGDWEEIPLDLVDLKKTRDEEESRAAALKKDSSELAAEEHAEREVRKEIESVPLNPGAYLIENGKAIAMKPADSKVLNSKKRALLARVSPIPVVSGHSTVELDGLHSPNVVKDERQEFYFRLSEEERFGLIRLTPSKTARIVEQVEIIPVTKDVVEKQDEVEIFRKQVGENFYKIWPVNPLPPGEYAIIEYTPGKWNQQIWDFRYEGGHAPN